MEKLNSPLMFIFKNPILYQLFQNILGANRSRRQLVSDFIRPNPGDTILDIGCGTADILRYLIDIDYWGFDISQAYISQAQKRFGEKGKFHCKKILAADLNDLPKFDIALALGLLHHIDDAEASLTLSIIFQALRPSGRLITIDPCIITAQNPITHFLMSNDRGKYVRPLEGYCSIARNAFVDPMVKIKRRSWFPYTHCIMECIR